VSHPRRPRAGDQEHDSGTSQNHPSSNSDHQPEAPRNLGTFLGVFTPSILTILGVILFLRTGWVVGNVGLLATLVIVIIANAITLATAMSVSAIATNMEVGVGGAYYMISRSLGVELGGAIGLPLYLAQAFSVTLYAFGLAESLQLIWPDLPLRPIAAATVLAVSVLAGRSAQLALRLQIPIMIAIGLALLSLVTGAVGKAHESLPLTASISGGEAFWIVFAVFFPSVTGIMAGVSLSGDLKEPKKAIPRGTIGAVLAGLLVYLAVPVILAASASVESLAANPLIWFALASVPMLIYPGLWGAIFSSALGSMLGAPRTLEALAGDRVVPRGLVGGSVNGTGPSRAHLASTALALAAVALGDLNAVAPVLTMFFLTTYGMINLVAGLEELTQSPAFRPTIRVWWGISLGGALACFWVMSLINWVATVAALAIEAAIYMTLRRRALSGSWGDMRYGTLMSLARATLLRLRELPIAPRSWRPHILVFAGDLGRRIDLVRFAGWLNQDRGLVTVAYLGIGSAEGLSEALQDRVREMQAQLDRENITAFAEGCAVPDFETGALTVAQAHGIAGIASNTIMFGWSEKPERMVSMLKIMRAASVFGKATVICRIAPRSWAPQPRRIDVWWGGLQNNGDLLVLLAHLLSLNPDWQSARIAVKCIVSESNPSQWSSTRLRELLEGSRIAADPEVIENPGGLPIGDIITEHSGDADIVFMGLGEARPGQEAEYADRLGDLVRDLPTVILVHAAGPFAGQLLASVEAPAQDS
jgi:amino acid transporter